MLFLKQALFSMGKSLLFVTFPMPNYLGVCQKRNKRENKDNFQKSQLSSKNIDEYIIPPSSFMYSPLQLQSQTPLKIWEKSSYFCKTLKIIDTGWLSISSIDSEWPSEFCVNMKFFLIRCPKNVPMHTYGPISCLIWFSFQVCDQWPCHTNVKYKIVQSIIGIIYYLVIWIFGSIQPF